MVLPKIIVSIVLIIGFVLIATNMEVIMPIPEDKLICVWGVCVPDVPANLAQRADWSFKVILFTGLGGILTIGIIAFIWIRGIPGKGGRFGTVK
jgi:hypothetical protein